MIEQIDVQARVFDDGAEQPAPQRGRPRAFRAPGGPLAPIVTILSCLLLMTGLTVTNWIRFFVWLVIGLCVYYFYSRKHSQLSDANLAAAARGGPR